MSAYEIAAKLLGDVSWSPGQLAELRAIDSKYQQRLFTLLHGERPDAAHRERPTDDELSRLDAMAAADIRAMLTPDQRRQLNLGLPVRGYTDASETG